MTDLITSYEIDENLLLPGEKVVAGRGIKLNPEAYIDPAPKR